MCIRDRPEIVQVVDDRAQHVLVGVVVDAPRLVGMALWHEPVEGRVVDDGADDGRRGVVSLLGVDARLLGLVVG